MERFKLITYINSILITLLIISNIFSLIKINEYKNKTNSVTSTNTNISKDLPKFMSDKEVANYLGISLNQFDKLLIKQQQEYNNDEYIAGNKYLKFTKIYDQKIFQLSYIDKWLENNIEYNRIIIE